jgi:hypothetical protein
MARYRDKQVPEVIVKMFPQYTRKQLYFMLYPFWTGISDRFKRKVSDVSAASITVKGLGRFEYKSSAKMRKTAAKFKKRQRKKARKFKEKKDLESDNLIY